MNRTDRARQELQSTIQSCVDSFVYHERVKATKIAEAKPRAENTAIIINYNHSPDFDDLPDDSQNRIALDWVAYKMQLTGDAAWIIEPLDFDTFANIVDSLIRNAAGLDDDVACKILEAHKIEINDYYDYFKRGL